MATYEVDFTHRNHYETQKVVAESIRESNDTKWLIFEDAKGEVRRFKEHDVQSVKRVEE